MATRIDWRHVASTALGILAGVVATAGTAAVAVAGFTLSYDAIRRVGVASYIRSDWAWLLPVSVDGAMAVATVTAVVMQRMGRGPWYPWLVVVTGAGISVGCNALHAYMRGGTIQLAAPVAMAVSAIPALMLALSVHLLVVLVTAAKRTLDRQDDNAAGDAAQKETTPADVAPAESQSLVAEAGDSDTAEAATASTTPEPSVGDTPAPATPAPATPAARVAAPRQLKPRTRDNDIDKQTARRRVRAGESCAVVASDLKVNKRAVERWTKDIREARQRATATPPGDGDDAEERAG